eukprot:12922552-Prorocentrum_lima.AAC.1
MGLPHTNRHQSPLLTGPVEIDPKRSRATEIKRQRLPGSMVFSGWLKGMTHKHQPERTIVTGLAQVLPSSTSVTGSRCCRD